MYDNIILCFEVPSLAAEFEFKVREICLRKLTIEVESIIAIITKESFAVVLIFGAAAFFC